MNKIELLLFAIILNISCHKENSIIEIQPNFEPSIFMESFVLNGDSIIHAKLAITKDIFLEHTYTNWLNYLSDENFDVAVVINKIDTIQLSFTNNFAQYNYKSDKIPRKILPQDELEYLVSHRSFESFKTITKMPNYIENVKIQNMGIIDSSDILGIGFYNYTIGIKLKFEAFNPISYVYFDLIIIDTVEINGELIESRNLIPYNIDNPLLSSGSEQYFSLFESSILNQSSGEILLSFDNIILGNRNVKFRLRYLSKDWYDYMQSFIGEGVVIYNLYNFSEPTEVLGNIPNGFGCVGGGSEISLIIE